MIKVITGPRFSGKYLYLLDEYDKKCIDDNILLFKPEVNIKKQNCFQTRNGQEINTILIKNLSEIKKYINSKITTIFIDEANLLTGDVNNLLDISINDNIDIFISGLNLTSEQKPFKIMPNILSVADEILIKTALCHDCDKEAKYTYFDRSNSNNQYIALCSSCLRKRKIEDGSKK